MKKKDKFYPYSKEIIENIDSFKEENFNKFMGIIYKNFDDFIKHESKQKGGAHGFRRNQFIAVIPDLLPENTVWQQLRIIEILPPEEGEEVMGDRMLVEDPTNGIRLNVHADVLWDAGFRPLTRTDSSKSGAGRKNKTLKKLKKGGAYSEFAKKLMKRRTRKKLHLHKNAKIIQKAYRDYIKSKRESERITDDQYNKYANMSYEEMMNEDY